MTSLASSASVNQLVQYAIGNCLQENLTKERMQDIADKLGLGQLETEKVYPYMPSSPAHIRLVSLAYNNGKLEELMKILNEDIVNFHY